MYVLLDSIPPFEVILVRDSLYCVEFHTVPKVCCKIEFAKTLFANIPIPSNRPIKISSIGSFRRVSSCYKKSYSILSIGEVNIQKIDVLSILPAFFIKRKTMDLSELRTD